MESIIENTEQPKRPTFLTVLCILSFVNLGISFISVPIALFTGPQSEEQVALSRAAIMEGNEELRATGMNSIADMMEKIGRMTEALNAAHYPIMTLTFLNVILALVGVWMMWNGRKLGFHLYIIYNIIATAYLYLFVSPADIPTLVIVFNLIFSGLFIFLYSRNLKWMK
ncbi:MAG: hypothetical protein V4638_08675 [Bacteroidota bacterium]